MPKSRPLSPLSPQRVRGGIREMVAIGLAAAALCGQPVAFAAPDASPDASPNGTPDAVTRLLIERGLLPADATGLTASIGNAAPTLAQKVRDGASDMVLTAMNFLGVPYKRGGSTEATGFDCSGFTRHIFEMSLGLVLPRRADEQANAAGLMKVGREDLRPGDLVFFNTMRRTFSHVGIYVGDGKFIHSPATGGAVRVDDMRYAYWSQRYNGARRAGPGVDLVPHAEAQTGASPR